MPEHVVPLELGVTWNPNAPESRLLADDLGRTALAMKPHHDDLDQRCVVLVWQGTRSACLAGPNDEAISGHRLHSLGLDRVVWAGEVKNSSTIRSLEMQNRVHPRHDAARFEGLVHHVILLKEGVAEVVARSISVRRLDGTTMDAVAAALAD